MAVSSVKYSFTLVNGVTKDVYSDDVFSLRTGILIYKQNIQLAFTDSVASVLAAFVSLIEITLVNGGTLYINSSKIKSVREDTGWTTIVYEGKNYNVTESKATIDSRIAAAQALTPTGGVDSDAIHVNVANEISGIATKATPVDGDFFVIEDSEDSNNKKKITLGSIDPNEYLNLDQTTPQTVINGTPDFSEGIQTESVEFDINYIATGAEPQGSMHWNETDNTVNLVTNGATLQLGQELYVRARNNTGVAIPNGSVVYIEDRTGIFPNIALAQGDTEATGKVLGITTEDIADVNFGMVTTLGYVRGLKTDYTGAGDWGTTWVAGDDLYLSKSVAGQLTNVLPTTPHHCDLVATVGVVHPTQGTVLVIIDKHMRLEELSDVANDSLTTDGQILTWNNSEGRFRLTDNITGYVRKTGTPADNQVAIFTDSDTVEGTSALTFDGTSLAQTTSVSPTPSDILYEAINSGVTRTTLTSNGSQIWHIYNGTSEAGRIQYSTPSGFPGIVFGDAATGAGRSQMHQTSATGGLSFGAGTTASNPGTDMALDTDGNLELVTGNLDITVGDANVGGGINLTSNDESITGITTGAVEVHLLGINASNEINVGNKTNGITTDMVFWTGSDASEWRWKNFQNNVIQMTLDGNNGGLRIGGNGSTAGARLHISGGISTKAAIKIDSQVAVTTPSAGELTFEGTGVLNFYDGTTMTNLLASGGATQLSDLSDVVSATNTNRFALIANGTTGFVSRAIVEADISDLGTYVNVTGTPIDNQLAVWTSADTVEGDANLTWVGTSKQLKIIGGTNQDALYIFAPSTTGAAIIVRNSANTVDLMTAENDGVVRYRGISGSGWIDMSYGGFGGVMQSRFGLSLRSGAGWAIELKPDDASLSGKVIINDNAANATAVLHIAGGDASQATLTLETQTAPTTPNDGDIWTETQSIKTQVNSVTRYIGTDSLENKTAAYTLVESDNTINVTANTFALTLPTAVGVQGKKFILKNSGSGTITINTTSSQTIDGTGSGVITLAQYEGITVQSDGTNYIIIES